MIRLFVALPIPKAIGAALTGLQNGLPGARWTAPENFHLTLRFIGEVDYGLAEDLAHGLDRIDAPGFEVELARLGWFGNKRRPSVVHAQVAKNEGLWHLQRKVESVVVRHGLMPESRKYHPHVTLGRLKTTSVDAVDRYIHERRLPGPLRFEADRFVLYSSFLAHTGSIYTEEADYPLRLREIAAAE
jgi:2'-5' RNA ligase